MSRLPVSSVFPLSSKAELLQRPPGVKREFTFFNNHANADAPANAIMLSQELGVRLKSMPPEAMLGNFPQLVRSHA
jgi:uncharacterized protein YecE (DUF72 family)